MNDRQFHQLRGDQLNDASVWASLTAKPLFFILNVAVGGDWVSSPRPLFWDYFADANSIDSLDTQMEIPEMVTVQ